jgi:hypothetical protein
MLSFRYKDLNERRSELSKTFKFDIKQFNDSNCEIGSERFEYPDGEEYDTNACLRKFISDNIFEVGDTLKIVEVN